MSQTRRPHTLLLSAVLICAWSGAGIAASRLIDWRDLEPGRLTSTYLGVERPVTARVKAVCTIGAKRSELIAYAWILDAESRKVIWILDPAQAKRDAKPRKKEGTVRVKEETSIRLEPGQYEVHFTTIGDTRRLEITTWFGWNVGKKSAVHHVFPPARDDWKLEVSVEDADRTAVTVGDKARPTFDPLLRIANPQPSESSRLPFRLDAPATVVVYGIGEIDTGSKTFADGGWIERGADRDIVWEMTTDNTVHAGGADKNRSFRGTVRLEPGSYILCYASDDSHGPGEWNMNPPHDPEFWGVAIFDYEGARAHFKTGGEDPITKNRIVELTRQRNNALNLRGIEVKRPINVRLLALGEYGGDRFADYGWIEEARTHRLVWSMNYAETEPAGGARKNRAARTVLSLPAGDYVVGYVTDDSHAYGSWNAAPPRDPESWGIQAWGIGDSFQPKLIGTYSEDQDPLILARLSCIGDSRDAMEKFSVKKPTRVRILAVGEGVHGQMFDYGWLKRVGNGDEYVWKMRYAATTHAGGHNKNRREVKELELAPGTYELHFVTDNSHSCEEWNAWPPDQPNLWGVTVTQID